MHDTTARLHQFGELALKHLSGDNGIAILLLWSTVLFAGVVTYIRANPGTWSLHSFVRHLLPAGIFHSASARADFLFWLSRRIFMPLLVLPLAISTVAAGHFSYRVLSGIFGAPAHPAAPAGPLLLVAFTVTMLIAYDLSYYLYHRMQHGIPILWELHKVHHSAQVMIGITKDRVHPIDEILNRWWDGVIPGLCYGIWLFFALDPVEVTVFGLTLSFAQYHPDDGFRPAHPSEAFVRTAPERDFDQPPLSPASSQHRRKALGQELRPHPDDLGPDVRHAGDP